LQHQRLFVPTGAYDIAIKHINGCRGYVLLAHKLVLPLPHLALTGLLPLSELRGVGLSVLQQSHHCAESDLTVSLMYALAEEKTIYLSERV
jgi:hypothetical protein